VTLAADASETGSAHGMRGGGVAPRGKGAASEL
jgi:hypothetical protein